MNNEKECAKIKFKTKEEAEQELRRIVESNDYRSWKQKTPCRYYQCSKHGEEEVWHLTSKPTIWKTWNTVTDTLKTL